MNMRASSFGTYNLFAKRLRRSERSQHQLPTRAASLPVALGRAQIRRSRFSRSGKVAIRWVRSEMPLAVGPAIGHLAARIARRPSPANHSRAIIFHCAYLAFYSPRIWRAKTPREFWELSDLVGKRADARSNHAQRSPYGDFGKRGPACRGGSCRIAGNETRAREPVSAQ